MQLNTNQLLSPKTWVSDHDKPGFLGADRCLGYPRFWVWENPGWKPYTK